MWPRPELDFVFGSGGRAAAALAGRGISRTLHTYLGPDLKEAAASIFGSYDFAIRHADRPVDPVFTYVHCLAIPTLEPSLLEMPSLAPMNISANRVVRFGMLEGDAVIDADMCVYDPQSAFSPTTFTANGSRARRLAIVGNSGEIRCLAGDDDVESAARRLLEIDGAEVVVAKLGIDGALVVGKLGVTHIPAFRVASAWTIGSGDVFVALFSALWMFDGIEPAEAALRSSNATANYIETISLPAVESGPIRSPIKPYRGKVYLAGPFFSIGQRLVIDEVRRCLLDFGIRVFSPVHDVGHGVAEDVAPKDIEAIDRCDSVLAILDGVDSGTLFEVGYARALNKPVFGLAQSVPEEDLKMVRGSGCIVGDDLASLIVMIAQAS